MTSRLTCVLLLLLSVARPSLAHPVPFSYLDVQVRPGAIEATFVAHVFDVAHEVDVAPPELLMDARTLAERSAAIEAILGPRITIAADGRPLAGRWFGAEPLPDRQAVRVRVVYPLSRPPGVVSIAAVPFPYDPNHRTFINVYEGSALTQAIVERARPEFQYVTGTRQGALVVIRRFLPSGIEHILIGPDHLLFLVGLLLLGGSIRKLTVIVTSFTIAHSVTLSLAALNLVTPPVRLVEPAIALSIVYVGADNLLVGRGRDLRAWIAFAFGFIHGFGFANVLREMDLPARALGWSLFSFNLGVEIGQLFVVIAVASALAALGSRSEAAGRRLAYAGSLVVIAAGAFWFVQRVFFPGGV